MATVKPCYNCGFNPDDLSGMTQLKRIERMIADNYTIVAISLVMIILLLFIMKYFGGQLIQVLKDYKKGQQQVQTDTKTTEDGEVYDPDEPTFDTTKYFDPSKKEFLNNMDTAYKYYNKSKGEYLFQTYSITNDDVIDRNALYKKYDDYKYKSDDFKSA